MNDPWARGQSAKINNGWELSFTKLAIELLVLIYATNSGQALEHEAVIRHVHHFFGQMMVQVLALTSKGR